MHELDVQCAKALGYTVYHYDKDYEENCYYVLMDGSWNAVISYPFRAGERKTEEEAWADVPRFSTDEVASRLLEDEVEKRGYEYPYERALIAIVYGRAVPAHEMGDIDLFPLIRATPDQRARAFLEAVKGDGL